MNSKYWLKFDCSELRGLIMIRKHRTKEEWQQIVDDFIPEQQTQKAYCKKKNTKPLQK